MATSVELIVPFAFTSSRKFELLTGMPTCDLVKATSVAFTAPLPFTSPTSTPMETGTLPMCVPSFTLNSPNAFGAFPDTVECNSPGRADWEVYFPDAFNFARAYSRLTRAFS